MTDHGEFVLFNAYVPTSQCLATKTRFLRALRAAMARQRALGRTVILAGDLNLSSRPPDGPWPSLLVPLSPVLGEAGAPPLARPLPPALAEKLARLAPGVRAVLSQLEVSHLPATAAPGGERVAFARTSDAWRVSWRPPDGGRPVALGKPLYDEFSARKQWCMDGEGDVRCDDPQPRTAERGGDDSDDEGGRQLLLRRGGRLAVSHLSEVVVKALQEPFSEEEQKAVADAAGELPIPPFLVDWVRSLVEKDGMVDTFAHARPNYAGRFTCWEQYTNARYENAGVRIDFIFADAALLPRLLTGAELADGTAGLAAPPARRAEPTSEEAARAAATACGRWAPAPFDGGGLVEAPMSVYDTQFERPGTGIRYMPPKYSDHTAVTLLLADVEGGQANLTLRLDAATLKACPQRSTRSITSFFSKKVEGLGPAEAEAAPAAKKAKPAAAPAGIAGLWAKKGG